MNANKSNYRNQYNASFVNKNYDEAYEDARRQVTPYRARVKPRGRVSASRTQYQTSRMDAHRSKTGAITESMLSEELRRKLLPGVKDSQTAADRLEAVNTLKAITVCITTRGIGFGTTHTFSALFEFNNVPVRGNIYQLYRACLAACEVKVTIVQRAVTLITSHEEDYEQSRLNEDLVIAAKGVVAIPDQLSSIINAIGKVKQFDSMYVPRIGRNNQTVDGRFIPQSEQVTFSNLRQVVLALADENTPLQHRLRFYNNNPIPGAIWNGLPNNPTLINGDEIIPANYGLDELREDITDVGVKLRFLNRKAPKYFTRPVSFEPDGSKAILICNKQGSLRVTDRNPGEALNEYYARMKVSGDVQDYYNLVRLTTGEQLDGNLLLLGELPATMELQCPVYMNRDERSAIEESTLGYRAALNIKYT